jgi:hypothetical protein
MHCYIHIAGTVSWMLLPLWKLDDDSRQSENWDCEVMDGG